MKWLETGDDWGFYFSLYLKFMLLFARNYSYIRKSSLNTSMKSSLKYLLTYQQFIYEALVSKKTLFMDSKNLISYNFHVSWTILLSVFFLAT